MLYAHIGYRLYSSEYYLSKKDLHLVRLFFIFKQMNNKSITTEKNYLNQNIAVIKVGGYLDLTTADAIEHAINSILKSNCYNIIIDLENVDYISSSGWSIFLSKIKEIRQNGGDLKLARMKPDVFEVFTLLEFFWFIKTYETLDEAISDFELGIPPMP